MSDNPYESPSAAGFEEAARARMVLDAIQRSTVQRFIIWNRLASLAMIGTGGTIALLIPSLLMLVRERANVLIAIAIAVFGVALIVWGILQLKRNIVAISSTSLVSTGLFSYALFAVVHDALLGTLPPIPPASFANVLWGVGFAAIVLGALVFVPAWLAIRAWQWRLRGIDLTALEKVEYRPAGGYLAVPPPGPGGNL